MKLTVIDDRYAIVGLLGNGGMAKVYLAYDKILDRDVALKVLREQYADDEEFVRRFRREAKSAARLSHANIVSVHDRGCSWDGAYYMAMEYVAGGTLKAWIRREGVLDPATAIGVALQIADALSAAHKKGVIHRDIKPQNILITDAGDAKVADFGIAKATSSTATATGTLLGTTTHISPEQALGEPAGPYSDLYSLGVVLYEMLTGELPYRAETPIGVVMKHLNEPPRSPREANPNVPKTLDALTMRLLAKSPVDRHPSAAALTDDLQQVRSELPPTVAGAEKIVRAIAHGRGRHWVGLLPGLVVLLFGAALIISGLTAARANLDAPQPGDSGDVVAQSTAEATPEAPTQEQKETPKAEKKLKGKEKEK